MNLRTSKKTKIVTLSGILALLCVAIALSAIGIYFSNHKPKVDVTVNPSQWNTDTWNGKTENADNFLSGEQFANRGEKVFTINSAESFIHFVNLTQNGEQAAQYNYFKDYTIYLNTSIDLANNPTEQIGKKLPNGESTFQGTFDGSYYTIFNANLKGGLFSYTTNATIKNIGLYNANIESKKAYTGGILDEGIDTTIADVYVRAGSIKGGNIAGLVGKMSLTKPNTLTNSFADTKLDGTTEVGLINRLSVIEEDETQQEITYTISQCYFTNSEKAIETSQLKIDISNILFNPSLYNFYKWNYRPEYDLSNQWCNYSGSTDLKFNLPILTKFNKTFLLGCYYENVLVKDNGEVENLESLSSAFNSLTNGDSAEVNLIVEKITVDEPAILTADATLNLNAAVNTVLTRGTANTSAMIASGNNSKLYLGDNKSKTTITIEGNKEYIEANNLKSDAAIIANGYDFSMNNVKIQNNINNSTGYGGGVLVYDVTAGQIYDDELGENAQLNIGGEITNCESTLGGGGLAVVGTHYNLSGNISYCKTAGNGGGAYLVDQVENTQVVLNSFSSLGIKPKIKLMATNKSSGGTISSSFTNSSGTNGGGMYAISTSSSQTTITFSSSTAEASRNTASANGGGVYISGNYRVNLISYKVDSNTVYVDLPYSSSGGQVAGAGGGMYIVCNVLYRDNSIVSESFRVSNNILSNNIGWCDYLLGGGIYYGIYSGTAADVQINWIPTDLETSKTFIIQNNSIQCLGSAPSCSGGGICISSSSPLDSRMCTSGVVVFREMLVDGNTIYNRTDNNEIKGSGGGICYSGNFQIDLNLTYSEICNNKAKYGGGIYWVGGKEQKTTPSTSYNSSPLPTTSTSLCYTKIHNNTATEDGGGIYNYINNNNGKMLSVFGTSQIYDNTAKVNGGGMFISGYSSSEQTSRFYMYGHNLEIFRNTAEEWLGGGIAFDEFFYGILCLGDGNDYMRTLKIYENTAAVSGGGFSGEGIDFGTYCEVAIYENTAERGGGLSVNYIGCDPFSRSDPFRYVNIENNTATYGGGMCIGSTGTAFLDARSIYMDTIDNPDNKPLHRLCFTGNKARNGAAVWFHEDICHMGDYYLSAYYADNVAEENGGAVYYRLTPIGIDCQLILDDSIFKNNVATNGDGGALYMKNVSFSYYYSEFISNQAPKGNGGAIYFYLDDDMSDDYIEWNTYGIGYMYFANAEVIFDGNSALNGGACYFSSISTKLKLNLVLLNVLFTNNSAEQCGGALYINAEQTIQSDNSFTFTGNHADLDGGAVYVNASPSVNVQTLFNFSGNGNNKQNEQLEYGDGTVQQNSAGRDGGAFYVNISKITSSQPADNLSFNFGFVSIANNTAVRNGGGIYINNNGYKLTLDLTSQDILDVSTNTICPIKDNTAGNYGGGIYNASKSPTNYTFDPAITDWDISGNTAEVEGNNTYGFYWDSFTLNYATNATGSTTTKNVNVHIHDEYNMANPVDISPYEFINWSSTKDTPTYGTYTGVKNTATTSSTNVNLYAFYSRSGTITENLNEVVARFYKTSSSSGGYEDVKATGTCVKEGVEQVCKYDLSVYSSTTPTKTTYSLNNITAPDATLANYKLEGWADSATATATTHAKGFTFTPVYNTTTGTVTVKNFYAVWSNTTGTRSVETEQDFNFKYLATSTVVKGAKVTNYSEVTKYFSYDLKTTATATTGGNEQGSSFKAITSAVAPTNSGYTFKGWVTDGTKNSSNAGSVIAANTSFTPTQTTYYATWQKDTAAYSTEWANESTKTINYNWGTGSGSKNSDTMQIQSKENHAAQTEYFNYNLTSTYTTSTGGEITKDYQGIITLPTAAANTTAGYNLISWHLGSASGTKYALGAEYKITTNDKTTVTFFAELNAITYTIVLNLADGQCATKSPITATFDVEITIENASKMGFAFAGWTATSTALYANALAGGTKWTGDATTLTTFKNLISTDKGSITLTATYTELTYKIHTTGENGSITVKETARYTETIDISRSSADDVGYDYTFVDIKIYTGKTASGTPVKTIKEYDYLTFNMSSLNTYYPDITMHITYSKEAKRYQITKEQVNGNINTNSFGVYNQPITISWQDYGQVGWRYTFVKLIVYGVDKTAIDTDIELVTFEGEDYSTTGQITFTMSDYGVYYNTIKIRLEIKKETTVFAIVVKYFANGVPEDLKSVNAQVEMENANSDYIITININEDDEESQTVHRQLKNYSQVNYADLMKRKQIVIKQNKDENK